MTKRTSKKLRQWGSRSFCNHKCWHNLEVGCWKMSSDSFHAFLLLFCTQLWMNEARKRKGKMLPHEHVYLELIRYIWYRIMPHHIISSWNASWQTVFMLGTPPNKTQHEGVSGPLIDQQEDWRTWSGSTTTCLETTNRPAKMDQRVIYWTFMYR